METSYPKLILAGILTLYFLWIAYNPLAGSLMDLVDLPIHETGHFVFAPFGEFMGFAGGSLFQIIMPAAFVGYFIWKQSYYSAAIVLFWVGQSILNVFVYAQDAVTMLLPLVGGGIHDWNWMLERLGWLSYTKSIAGMIRLAGTLTIFVAAILSIYFAFNSPLEEYEEI
jgi:hypothetical protein